MTKEEIYNQLIRPLMNQIVKISAEHKIAFMANFAVDNETLVSSANLRTETEPLSMQLDASMLIEMGGMDNILNAVAVSTITKIMMDTAASVNKTELGIRARKDIGGN